MKKSPFYALHVKANATMSDGAWCTPAVYTNIAEEYDAVRNGVALSDWSTMGKFEVQGAQAKEFVQKMIVNDVDRLKPGLGLYSAMLNEQGGIFDDTTVYQLAENHYLIVGSTARREQDTVRFAEHSKGMHVCVTDMTSSYGILSVQGPKSRDFLNTICSVNLDDVPYFGFKVCKIANCEFVLARTGFTGELGFELYVRAEDGNDVWEALIEGGKPFGLKLCGISAGVSLLRLEKGYLAGKEYNETINPYEVGLGWSVRLNTEFIGCEALKKIKEQGTVKTLMGFIVSGCDDLGVPDGDVTCDGQKVGIITSTCFSPALKKSIGMAFIDAKYAKLDQVVSVTTTAGMKEAKLCSKVFYDPTNSRAKA